MASSDIRHLSLRQRLALELDRKVRHDRVARHQLRTLFWECTHRCNLRCRHCGSDCKTSALHPDMPAADFLRVIDSIIGHLSLEDRHRLNVVITGGEPTVRSDLEEVGLQLYRREIPWGIVTNGLLLTLERFDSLRRAGIYGMTISLDGGSESHNWMRGNPMSYRRASDAIRMVAQSGDVNFDVVTCVNRRSLPELPAIRDQLIDSGVKAWRLFTIFPSGRAKQYEEFDLNSDEIRRLMDFIVETRREGRIDASFCCEGFMGAYEGKVRRFFFHCDAGVSVASVLIDGSIGACPSIRADYTQGNIYTDDFWDVWTNRYEAYRNRRWMRTGECADCSFWRYCEGNGMHLRDADGRLMHCHLLK